MYIFNGFLRIMEKYMYGDFLFYRILNLVLSNDVLVDICMYLLYFVN